MGKTIEEIGEAAKRAYQARADIIELRIDSFDSEPTAEAAIAACREVYRNAPGTPLIFTLRTERDGGAGSRNINKYEVLLNDICSMHAADAIDCELSVGADAFVRITQRAHEEGIAVIGSSHEFGRIGDMIQVGTWLSKQEELGADICKAAVMTQTKAEAFEAAYVMAKADEQLSVPMIAIAMGPSGVLTRIGAECLGSCLTFGTAGAASAPGQIDARELRSVLEIVHAAGK
ncbi:MAG: type I 3-dehydroquinate dehydratase [Clostridia bacterium]|nr:type I 3-dehydroquinate dehydratase [Clostridia bacterium]